MVRTVPALATLLAATLLFCSVGCDKGIKRITVRGTVMYDNKPVTSGILRFIGPNGAYSAARLGDGGRYEITDVVPGETKIGIMESPQSSGSSSGGAQGASVAPVQLPEKFRDPEKSGVVYTITPQTKELNIELK
jgi:hypothetical protein